MASCPAPSGDDAKEHHDAEWFRMMIAYTGCGSGSIPGCALYVGRASRVASCPAPSGDDAKEHHDAEWFRMMIAYTGCGSGSIPGCALYVGRASRVASCPAPSGDSLHGCGSGSIPGCALYVGRASRVASCPAPSGGPPNISKGCPGLENRPLGKSDLAPKHVSLQQRSALRLQSMNGPFQCEQLRR